MPKFNIIEQAVGQTFFNPKKILMDQFDIKFHGNIRTLSASTSSSSNYVRMNNQQLINLNVYLLDDNSNHINEDSCISYGLKKSKFGNY